MSTSASFFSFSLLNCREPLFAITPRLLSSSSGVMPMPLSVILSVRLSLSTSILIKKSSLLRPVTPSLTLL